KSLRVLLAVAVLLMFNAFGFTGIGLLQGIDAKFWGVLVMGGAVVVLFFLPWLGKSPVNDIPRRPDDPGTGLLQGMDAKFWGVLVMGGAVVVLFFLPWLDKSPVKSIRYRPG